MASPPQSQDYLAQQPMSLLRVEGFKSGLGPSEDESNLLTIRILEASERKMRMIKELLTPEQFQSLSSDLFAAITPPHHTGSYQASERLRRSFKQAGHENSSDWPQPKQVEFADEDNYRRDERQEARRKTLSKSETNLDQSSELRPEPSELLLSRSQQNIQENLAKKRQAVEFFFGGYSAPGPTESLAIELRFGHYLRANLDAEDKLMQEQTLSGLFKFSGLGHLFARLMNLFLALINVLCSICPSDSSHTENADDTNADRPSLQNLVVERRDEEELRKRHRKFNGLPYSSDRNMAIFVARLRRDQQQLDKLLGQARPVLAAERRAHKQTISASEVLAKQLILIKLDSDHSFRLAGDLNRRVMSLERAQPKSSGCDLATESKFLIHQPLVVRMTRALNKQKILTSGEIQCAADFGHAVVLLDLESLKLISHKWDLQEEILARRLQEEFTREYLERLVKPLEKVVRGINELAGRITSEFAGHDEQRPLPRPTLMNRMFSLVEMRAKLLSRISAKQRKLAMIWNELRAARDEQTFNSTSLMLDLSDQNSEQPPLGSLDHELLTRSLDHLRELILGQEPTEGDLAAAKHLKRWQKFVAAETSSTPVVNKHQLLGVRLLHDLPRTSDQSCPHDELKRRQRLEQWLGSLDLKLILNDDYHYDLSPTTPGAAKISENKLGQRQVDLTERTGGPIELRLRHNPNELKLAVVVSERGNYFLPAHLNRLIAAASGKKICEATFLVAPVPATDSGQRYELALEVPRATDPDDDDLGEATRLSLVVTLKFKARLRGANESRLNTSLIDFLCSIVFDDAKRRRNAFEDTPTRARKLLNRVNARLLLALMGKLDKSDNLRSAKFCLLEPHFRPFSSTETTIGRQQVRFLPNARPVSLRHALLVWRWITGQSEPICLSDRENERALTTAVGLGGAHLLEEFRSRAKLKNEALTRGQAEGYKLIEHTRALALDYIRQCELLVDQIIGLEPMTTTASGASSGPQNAGPGPRTRPRTTRDLLIEPQLNWLMARPSLPNAAQIVLALVPRPTARRPLMPDRRRRRKMTAAGQSNSLGHLVDLSQVRGFRLATSEDLEGEALGQWRRVTASGRKLSKMQVKQQQGGGSSNLRLVVTIQQAINVPLRLASAQSPMTSNNFLPHGYPHTMRSGSPMFSPSPMIGPASPQPPAMSSPIQISARQQQLEFLEPATTYVEAVFQRHQLTSSLAQGTSPAWNETLFFDVHLDDTNDDEDKSAATGGNRATQQLADEFLHLNLYDCRAYIQNDPFQQQLAQAQPFGGVLTQQRMQQPMTMPGAQYQRIERHLLGSLRVPMSVLLTTSGRLEGSFALERPLLLEHAYKFDQSESNLLASGGGGAAAVAGVAPRTSLSLFITLDPPVSLPPMSGIQWHLPTGSSERTDLFEYARLWERIMLQVPARVANARRRHRDHTSSSSSSRATSGRTTTAAETRTAHIRALVLRDDARYCLACRFLASLRPPESLMMQDDGAANDRDQDQRQQTMRRLARFVSLLSPLKQGHFRMRSLASSLWFDSHQLLHDALGGQEEKAALLCNYFLHLGKCAGLLLADCIPDGRCIYVLVWSSSDQDAAAARTTSQLELQVSELMETLGVGGNATAAAAATEREQQPPVDATNFIARLPILIHSRACQIWDPKTGVCYRPTTGGPPLPAMSVDSIVTPENVYANLQQQQTSSTHTMASSGALNSAGINFDIRQRNLWFPLFSVHARLISETSGGADSNSSEIVRRESRRLLHVHNWRKQLAQLDTLSRMIGRPVLAPATRSPPAALDYSTFTRDQCQELRDHIERQIKSNLLIWRPTRPTYFNRTLSRILVEKLASFERSILGIDTDHDSQQVDDRVEFDRARNDDPNWWCAQLAELIRAEILDIPTLSAAGLAGGGETRQVISWPINLAYSNIRVILDSLYASGVHNADLMVCEQQQLPTVDGDQSLTLASPSLSTQFLVACHVEPYPAHTMSVWLYVGAIVATTTNVGRAG